jgi:AcrR family transcriptional regulator
MTTEVAPTVRGDATREALIAAAITCFARDGFRAASLRVIAASAGVNQALIGYHFQSKEGLYLATFAHIVSQIRERLDPVVDEIAKVLGSPDEDLDASERAARYLPPLLHLSDGMVSLMAQEQSTAWSLMITREQQYPTAAFALLYDGFMARILELLTQLVLRLSPATPASEARLTVITLMGQVMVFRFARAGMLRHLGWEQIGGPELDAIKAAIRRNITALLQPPANQR